MSALANYLARNLWWAMLWLMRRPVLKRLRRYAPMLAPRDSRDRIRRRMIDQDRFARRHGLGVLRFALSVLLASLTVTVTMAAVLQLYDSGMLTVPDSVRARADALDGASN